MELPDSVKDECFIKDNLGDLFENAKIATEEVEDWTPRTSFVNTFNGKSGDTQDQEQIPSSNIMLDNFLHEQTTNNFLIKNELMKFVEKFDEAKLLYIIDNYYTLFPKENSEKIKNELNYKNKYSKNGGEVEFDWNTYQYYNLKKYYERSKNGEVEVEYYQNHGRGRYYAKDGVGMASFSRLIRHTISNKYALDLDIKNSSPSILLNLIKKTGDKTIKTKYLEEYIQNRDKFLDELMKNNSMDRKDAKSFYIAVMNSKFIKNEDIHNYPESLIHFYNEQKEICKKLKLIYHDYYEEVKRLKDEKIKKKNIIQKYVNYDGSFMSHLLFDKENEILMNIKSIFERRNINVYGLQFDGLFFDKNVNINYLLEECNNEINNKMNYNIYFDFKQLDDILDIKNEDLQTYQDIIELNKFIGINKSRLCVKEALHDLKSDNSIQQYQLIIKCLYNIFNDIVPVFLYFKKWLKDNELQSTDQEIRNDINEVVSSITNKDKKYNLEVLQKIVNKQKKEKEKEEDKRAKEKLKNTSNDDEYIQNLTNDELIIIEELKMLKKDYTTAQLIKEKSEGRFVVALEKSDDELIKTLYCFNDFYSWKDESRPLNRWYTGDTLLKIWISEVLYKIYLDKYNEIKPKILNKHHRKLYEIYIDNLIDHTAKVKIVESCKDILWDEHIIFNTSPLLFGFTDGIYELDTGIFREYTKNDYITKNCGWDWNNGDSNEETEIKKETVRNIIDTIMPDKDNKRSYLDLLCAGLDGYAYQYMALFIGIGKNSKSMINDWIREDIGEYGCKLPNTCIFEQSSSGPNPAMAKMNLMRFMHFSEPDPDRKADNGVFKEITGGGIMNNRKAFSNKCKVILSGMLYCELNKYFKFKNLISHAEKRRLICLPFSSIFTDDEKLLKKGGVYKKENEEYGTRIFQIKHRKALFSLLLEHYQDFFKRGRKFYLSKDSIDETNKYLNINITLRNWFFNNYEFVGDKFYIKEFENTNGNKIHRKCLIYKKIGNNESHDGIFNHFLQSETFKNLLSKEDKVEYSNHLNFIKHLLEIEEVKNNYHQDKWIRLDGEKIHLYNVILSLKDKDFINNHEQIIGTFDNPEIWD